MTRRYQIGSLVLGADWRHKCPQRAGYPKTTVSYGAWASFRGRRVSIKAARSLPADYGHPWWRLEVEAAR
jgi:hypothetical protein